MGKNLLLFLIAVLNYLCRDLMMDVQVISRDQEINDESAH